MKKIRATVSVLSLMLFAASAVTGFYMWLTPHPPRITAEAVQAAGETARAIGQAVGERAKHDGFNVKIFHLYASLVLTGVIFGHLAFNWKILKSYLTGK